jgi:2-polyprenyl-6-methoxyphenol hydroxylase-like FAD-dependent oxidoreductase
VFITKTDTSWPSSRLAKPPKPVIIVGSGLGGLALAQGLQTAGIPFRVYERDSAVNQRTQGYRIRINDVGLDALRQTLPVSVYSIFEQTCARNEMGMGRFNARTGQRLPGGPEGGPGQMRPPPTAQPLNAVSKPPANMFSLPADRRMMRRSLMFGLESSITYDKTFATYNITASGVTAHFTDGTASPEGSLLVGADGTGSRVAAQLVGDALKPKDTGSRMAYGKTFLTPALEQRLAPELQRGMCIVDDPDRADGRLILFLEAMRFDGPDASENYVYWVLIGDAAAFGMPDEKLLHIRGREAAEMTVRVTVDWEASFKSILEAQNADETAILRMTTANPNGIAEWPANRFVTLLGDSIHNMPPAGGSGANTALRDAALLCDTLKAKMNSGEGDEQAIGKYEKEVRSYASEMVARSYRAGVTMFGVKPLASDPW